MKGCSNNCSSNTPTGGNGYILKGGSVWTNAALGWWWTWAGSQGSPIYIGYDPAWNAGTVLSVRPTTSGYNCSSISVGINGGGGTGAAGSANFQTSNYLAGLLQHVTLNSAGSGYTSNPAVSFSGSCTVFPTAVADIYSPIIDASGTIWNESNGAQTYYGPILFSGVNYVTVDHLEFRNALFDHTISPGSGGLALLTQQSGDQTIWQNVYVHNAGPDVVEFTGSPSFNNTGLFLINGGYAGTVTVQNSFIDNYENEVFVPCGWNNGSPANFTPPCGSSLGVAGATILSNNVVHDTRGQVYSRAITGNVYSGNMIWDSVYDCCEQHEDTFYFYGSGAIYNNVIHDAAPLGAANFYIETCMGNPCTTGNVTYLFNNLAWNVGRSTPPIGFSSEFWGTSNVSPSPALYAWNNTFYSYTGTTDCINAGQWFGSSSTSTVNFYLYNNHCISDQSSSHWYDSNGGNYGTWNGLSNPNSPGTQATIDAANTVMSPATAASQGYTIANQWAPTASSNGTVVASGSDLTSSNPGCGTPGLPSLCSDVLGVLRPQSGTWNTGAYQYGSAGNPPQPPTALTAIVN
jgi:hypothetical protein